MVRICESRYTVNHHAHLMLTAMPGSVYYMLLIIMYFMVCFKKRVSQVTLVCFLHHHC